MSAVKKHSVGTQIAHSYAFDVGFASKPEKIPRSPLGMTAFKRSAVPKEVRDLEQTECPCLSAAKEIEMPM
jgi:hypothetical protein